MAGTPAVDDPLASLPIPPFSPSIFTDDLILPDDYLSFDYEDLGITFDDNHNPPDTEQPFDSTFNQSGIFDPSFSKSEFNDFVSDLETIVPEAGDLSGNSSGNLSGNLIVKHVLDASGSLNIPSPDDFDETVKSTRILNNYSSESRNENPASSQGSGNCDSAESEAAMIRLLHDSGNSDVNRKMTREIGSNFMLKRKESCDVNLESRTMKHRKSNESSATTEIREEDEKKKARLIRNRESAQLSRQRKKQYVEELEDKVRAMHATIQDLNARITYITAENATLKQQMVATAGAGGGAPVMYPPHPAMPPMGYPWIPFPPYAFISQGSQVPLLPIPRLIKTQCKKDVNKTEGKSKTKTKKVASISFIGLLLFVVLFGGLVPIMNVKFGGLSNNYPLSSNYHDKFNDYKLYNQQHHGRVLRGDEHVNRTNYNSSEPLVASLYVPRNNKLVKIDGSLIISSVLASEKAMANRAQQRATKKEDTSLAVVPAVSIPTVKRIQSDGKPQQWFRESLSGLMLSSGMCTEVFQFDASVSSPSGAIVPAMSAVNITAAETRQNSTYITTVKNRRILHGLPVTNITKEQVAGHDSKHKNCHSNESVSSMVVSVLVDPREAGDGGDVDGGMMGGGKASSFSRIFVVVLLDSVNYVTYSCMLPVKGGSL